MNIDWTKDAIKTPRNETAGLLTSDEKKEKIEFHFTEIMKTLGLDLSNDSLQGTPARVAKMYVEEIFSGLDPANKPSISLFDNTYGYYRMLVEKNITLYSNCEHHFVPIIGKVHVAYIPGRKVIGLSKINRLVQYYGRRPQVQERLTMQIARAMQDVLHIQDVAVLIEADHLCVASRGIQDTNSKTVTTCYYGEFERREIKEEFLVHLRPDR